MNIVLLLVGAVMMLASLLPFAVAYETWAPRASGMEFLAGPIALVIGAALLCAGGVLISIGRRPMPPHDAT
jgi:hypothetical protein